MCHALDMPNWLSRKMIRLSKLYLTRLRQTTLQMIRYYMFIILLLCCWHYFYFLIDRGLFLQSTELHIYTDFLRIVLEVINAILTYALPRNPEVCAH
jgi:hypothetical protein